MQYRQFGSRYFVRIDKGEEILASLKNFCEQEKITLAEVKALGAVDDFNVGLFDVAEKKYHTNHFQFPAEIVSLWGTVTTKDGKFYAHIHMSAADKDGHVFGGHHVEKPVLHHGGDRRIACLLLLWWRAGGRRLACTGYCPGTGSG